MTAGRKPFRVTLSSNCVSRKEREDVILYGIIVLLPLRALPNAKSYLGSCIFPTYIPPTPLWRKVIKITTTCHHRPSNFFFLLALLHGRGSSVVNPSLGCQWAIYHLSPNILFAFLFDRVTATTSRQTTRRKSWLMAVKPKTRLNTSQPAPSTVMDDDKVWKRHTFLSLALTTL